jgi:Saxitoxin biosynthesis operon protein SxtJ
MFAGIGVLLAGFNFYKEGSAWPVILACAGLFLIGGLFGTPLLRPVYILWMRFASLLAWVNTRIVLGIAFFLVLTPIGVLMRIFGKDSLGLTMEPKRDSYWIRREQPYERHQTEKQF